MFTILTQTMSNKPTKIPAFFTTWSKFADPFSRPSPETFPELPDCVAIVRILVGFTYGLSLGYRDVVGGFGVMMGCSAVMFLPLIYVEQFLKAQVNAYSANIAVTGVVYGMASCLLVWIIFYNMNHADLLEDIVAAGGESSIIEEDAAIESMIEEDIPNAADTVGGGDEFDF